MPGKDVPLGFRPIGACTEKCVPAHRSVRPQIQCVKVPVGDPKHLESTVNLFTRALR